VHPLQGTFLNLLGFRPLHLSTPRMGSGSAPTAGTGSQARALPPPPLRLRTCGDHAMVPVTLCRAARVGQAQYGPPAVPCSAPSGIIAALRRPTKASARRGESARPFGTRGSRPVSGCARADVCGCSDDSTAPQPRARSRSSSHASRRPRILRAAQRAAAPVGGWAEARGDKHYLRPSTLSSSLHPQREKTTPPVPREIRPWPPGAPLRWYWCW
jgi:hypothetical protein